MPVAALITWVIAALAGLYLLAIWLIEYDPEFQRVAATRLPPPVVAGHVLFAVGGLVLWVLYIITGRKVFSWATVAALALVATFGLTMAVRWIGVYRARPARTAAPAIHMPHPVPAHSKRAEPAGQPKNQARHAELAVPPERHFPVSAVIAHGVLAVTTILLVALTIVGAGRP